MIKLIDLFYVVHIIIIIIIITIIIMIIIIINGVLLVVFNKIKLDVLTIVLKNGHNIVFLDFSCQRVLGIHGNISTSLPSPLNRCMNPSLLLS